MKPKIRLWIRSAVELTSTETGAFIVLLPVLLLVMTSGRIYHRLFPERPPDFLMEISPDSIFAVKAELRPLVAFDPNSADVATLTALGIEPRLAERVVRFRSKGGRFRTPSDLAAIYGMDSSLFQRLEPWIQIAEKTKTDTTHRFRKPAKPVRRVEYDLNLADTADFESVSGIGKKMAARIVRYRTALGGFIRREQLYEVFGIDSLAVFSMDRFHVTATFSPAMVQVNAATWEELDAHPYLTPMQARAVLMYRFQHGRIAGEQELMKVRLMDAKTVERIRPYLDYR